jgi:hypothetical protein
VHGDDFNIYYLVKLNRKEVIFVKKSATSLEDTYSIIWVEYIRGWRIIHNDHRMKVPAKLIEVFDVVASMKHARLPEESCPEDAPPVQKISYWIGILRNDNF